MLVDQPKISHMRGNKPCLGNLPKVQVSLVLREVMIKIGESVFLDLRFYAIH